MVKAVIKTCQAVDMDCSALPRSYCKSVCRNFAALDRFYRECEPKLQLVCREWRGTPPGDSLADVLFGLSFLALQRQRCLHRELGHLVQLAKTNGAVLATLDRKIPDTLLIPEQ